ncbi:MAG: MBL fold metallo-hydrolase [Desulfurococcales archaeon]|nr:MBL fold metallo-hydrolase [Desulfurococcales archaeon]
MPPVKITILVDNSAPLPTPLIAEYGFSALVEDEGTGVRILFDTGTSGVALEYNLEKLGVDPGEIDYVVLSHRHYDHTGGLKKFLEMREGRKITVIAHERLFEPAYARIKALGGTLRDIGIPYTRRELEDLGARFLLTRSPVEITDDIIVSGEIPRKWGPSHSWGMLRLEEGSLVEDDMMDDMALYIRTGDSLTALTGCGHAGVENIVEHGLETLKAERLHGIIGGLHLLGAPPDRIPKVVGYLKSKSPRLVAATHCTGPLIQGSLLEALGDAYRLAGTGTVVRIG